MTIDNITIHLYTCCKCGHKWTNWDAKNKIDGPVPTNCPSCRNVRWNQTYTKEEVELVKRLEEQHLIKKDSEIGAVHNWSRNKPEPQKWSQFDFIVYDFLYKMFPSPEITEITQVLKIPKKRIEERHELVLSIIKERIKNKEEYEKAYRKYSRHSWYRLKRHIDEVEKEQNTVFARRRAEGCKHNENAEILIAYYTFGPYMSKYQELKMHESEHLPISGAKPVEWSVEAKYKKENEEMRKAAEEVIRKKEEKIQNNEEQIQRNNAKIKKLVTQER